MLLMLFSLSVISSFLDTQGRGTRWGKKGTKMGKERNEEREEAGAKERDLQQEYDPFQKSRDHYATSLLYHDLP